MTPIREGAPAHRSGAVLLALAACVVLGLVTQAGAQSRGQSAARPLTPAPAANPSPAGARAPGPPAIPAASAIGICQCIADRDRRHILCLASAPECQSSCASTDYSFVPDAPSCPVIAQER